MTAAETPIGAGDVQRLVMLLDEQVILCRRLDELGGTQEACIESADTDGLLRVLAERQTVVDRVGALSSELEPLRTRRDAVLAALPERERVRVRALVADLRELAERIQRRDEAGRNTLEERRGRIADEIAGVARSRGAMAAYGRASGSFQGARIQDRQG